MKEKCQYCNKMVKNSRFLGTLHICLLPSEIALIDQGRWQILQQKMVIRAMKQKSNNKK